MVKTDVPVLTVKPVCVVKLQPPRPPMVITLEPQFITRVKVLAVNVIPLHVSAKPLVLHVPWVMLIVVLAVPNAEVCV